MNVDVFGHEVQLQESLVGESNKELRKQITAYTAGERRDFDLTVTVPEGFTGEVMRALLEIPPGETRTYGELAAELGTAPRAVGGGCARNPLPIVVPCHRVTAVDGLGGFQYPGLKERLLELEGAGTRKVDR